MIRRLPLLLLTFSLLGGLLLPACSATIANTGRSAGRLNVVATTTIVADVVQNIGGDAIQLSVLIQPNVDEHAYEPTPQDAAKIDRAALVFMNGAGLETFMQKLMQSAGSQAVFVSVSDGIPLLQGPAEDQPAANGSPSQMTGDPHVWMDPNNVLVWVDNIEKALSAADPAHAADFRKNADIYRQKLKDLDAWVRQQVAPIPQPRRELVTDHLVFTYFASRYNFRQVGAVVPGYSTLSASSAQELAALEDQIKKLAVPAIFVGNTVNPALSERVAADTHTRLVHILTGSLTDKNGPAPTYIDYIHYNVKNVAGALQ